MTYRQGNFGDLEQLRNLALNSWEQFKKELTADNWQKLFDNLSSKQTYLDLLNNSHCIVCETSDSEIIGMAFLVPNGHPTEIYDANWGVHQVCFSKPTLWWTRNWKTVNTKMY